MADTDVKLPTFDKEKWAEGAAAYGQAFKTALKHAVRASRTGKKKEIAHFAFLAYIAGTKDGAELCQRFGVPPKEGL